MKSLNLLPLGAALALMPSVFSQTLVTIDSSDPLGAFMVANELPANGGAYVFADNWGANTASGNYSGTDTIVLGPENGAYDASGDIDFWRENGVGPLGNKEMVASVFVNADGLVGQDVSFDFTVDSNTFTEHTSVAFIKIFDTNYNILNEVEVSLTELGYYNLSISSDLTSVADAVHAQYGFTTTGINSSAAQAPSYGTLVISASEPMDVGETWGGYPVELDESGNKWANTDDWIGYVSVTFAPWVYILNTGSWAYMNEPNPTDGGVWTYFLN